MRAGGLTKAWEILAGGVPSRAVLAITPRTGQGRAEQSNTATMDNWGPRVCCEHGPALRAQ